MNSAMDEHMASMSGGEGQMPLTGPRGWIRFLRSGIELMLVRADWLTTATTAIRRRPRPELTYAVPGWQFWLLLASALFDIAWLAAWSLVAVRFQSRVAIFFASFPVLKWLLLLVARQTAASNHVEEPIAQAMTDSTGVFRQATPVTEQASFETETPRQFWMADQEIVSHHISGAVQE
jgi:hypothetical protein